MKFSEMLPRVWRAASFFGVLSALAFVSRTALDWFVPPETFYARSTLTTFTAFALFTASGFWTTWRTRSLSAGVLAGILTAIISAAIDLPSSLMLLIVRHDPATMTAIERSGGLSEVFTLPIIVAIPGTILATLGGALGKGLGALTRRPYPRPS